MAFSLDASDRVALDTCTLDHDALVDAFTADRYRLGPTAAALLAGCDGRARAGDLAAEHAAAYGVDPAVLLHDLGAFVGELAEVGLVRVRRPWRHHMVGGVLDVVVPSPASMPVVRRRFPPTALGCVQAVVHAGRVLVVLTVVWTAALVGAVAAYAPGVALSVGLAPAAVGLGAVASVIAHELAHLGAVRATGGRTRYLAAGSAQVAVVHDVTDPGRRRWVALAGPVAGALSAVLAWALVAAVPHPGDLLAVPLAVLVAGCQLAGLVPWTRDGRHLWAVAR